ncbi:hypothetical protein ACF3NX_10295 [Acetobacter orientalis]|uniref:hypothetical protein n=1 Tax=Acetobacter orientalis TaxID=146474 RepID=UPI00386CF252
MRFEFCLPRPACLLAYGVLLVVAASGSVQAATTLKGEGLVINAPCLSTLHITANATQPSSVQIDQPLPAGISTSMGKDNVITLTQKNCTASSPLAPPLTLSTRPELPLTIENAGRSAVVVDDRTGTLFVQAGSAPVELGKSGELGLVSASTGPITIRTLADSARIRSEVAAPVTIKAITAPAIALYLGGKASFTAESGHLQALEITSASTQDALVHATTDVGVFHVQSSGNIIVDKVSGTLATERDGSGKIIPDAAAPPPPEHATRVTVIPEKR